MSLWDTIIGNSNSEYFDYFPGLKTSDSTGILGQGLLLSGTAPVGTGSVLNPNIWSTGGILELASQAPAGAQFLASQQQQLNQYLQGGLANDLLFPTQVLNLLQGGGDPNLSFGANYLQSVGLGSWVEAEYLSAGAELYGYAHYLPSGDVYYGWGYAASGTFSPSQYFIGYTYGDGSSSVYQITEVYQGYGNSLIGQVNVSNYYDVETNSYANVASNQGFFGLGSESGNAYNGAYSNADSFFGFGYEADLLAAPSNVDLYTFNYYYPNGDTYLGYGYTAQGTFNPGDLLTGYVHESGFTGTYEITGVYGGYNSSLINQVIVTDYYDVEANSFTYVQPAVGYFGLGSESGYAYLSNYVDGSNFFGLGNEADVIFG
jgi:hypothetical protein